MGTTEVLKIVEKALSKTNSPEDIASLTSAWAAVYTAMRYDEELGYLRRSTKAHEEYTVAFLRRGQWQ